MSIFIEHTKKQIDHLEREIEGVLEEMDRRDSFDAHSSELKAQLRNLHDQLAKNKGLLEKVQAVPA